MVLPDKRLNETQARYKRRMYERGRGMEYEVCYGSRVDSKLSEAQAEIARLQSEVERTNDVLESQAHMIRDLKAELELLRADKLYSEKAKDRAILLEKHSIRDTAWNDAIEAAASVCDSKSGTEMDVKEPEYYTALGYELAAEDIRALHRPT